MKRGLEKLIAWLSSDTGLKLFSFFFAVGLWLFVNAGQKTAERSLVVPVEFRNVPVDLVVTSSGPGQVEVRAIGPPALLSTLDPDYLKVVMDLEGARPGTSTFRLGSDSFNPPRGVRITRVSPSVINLKLEAVVVRSLPVSVRLGTKPPAGYKVSRVDVNPETVRVRGPANEVSRMGSIETLPIELEGAKGQITREVRLSSAGDALMYTPDRVTVSVLLEEEVMTREFSKIDVKAKDFSGKYSVSPRQAYLRLSGPKRILNRLQLGPEQVYLSLKGLGPGAYTVPLSVNLPQEIKVIEQKPERFKVTIQASG
jgi:YbbR domain-containing protein